jgi:nucleotidyltransferase/DNA polymerase involved in DNA repair
MSNKVIFLVDMQTFYASCEKAAHPEWRNKPVIVAGDPEQRSGIVLAADPIAKRKYGVKTAEFVGQAVLKCPQAILVRPRMQHYIDVSLQITEIFESFTDLVEPYSIDEQFLDVTGSQRLFGSPIEIARKIQQKIMKNTGIYARVGIGPNKVLAKMACDNFAKHNETGIFELNHNNIKKNLWPLPINCAFGIGNRMERNLIGMGIRTIGMLASYPLDLLKKRWGINGVVLWQTANGIDYSPVTPNSHAEQKSIGRNITLPYDYTTEKEIKVVLLELAEDVAYVARQKHCRGQVVSVGVRGANFDFPTGFYRQTKLLYSTNFGMDVYKASCRLFKRYWDRQPIRSIAVSLSTLQPANYYQLDLFNNLIKKERLAEAVDSIYRKYGRTAIFRSPSLSEYGQLFNRTEKIGGHWK